MFLQIVRDIFHQCSIQQLRQKYLLYTFRNFIIIGLLDSTKVQKYLKYDFLLGSSFSAYVSKFRTLYELTSFFYYIKFFSFQYTNITFKMDPRCRLVCFFMLSTWLPLADAVSIDDNTTSYIQSCITTYEENHQNTFFDNIILPPMNFDVHMDENMQRTTFLPKLILWCPMTMHRLKIMCPKHHTTLKATYWQCKNDIWRQPRLVYDMNGNILLVSRMYICSRECRFLSSDTQVLDMISNLIYVPFTLFHKCGYTDTLKEHINGQICVGVSFSQIQTSISETHGSYFCRKLYVVCKKILIKKGKTLSNYVKDKLLDEMVQHYLYTAPSSELLIDIFLDNFEKHKNVFEECMKSLTAESISTDHTFKISKNIRIHDLENHWSKQYESVLIIMNEDGQVIAWTFTKSQSFEEVRPLFEQLRDRLLADGRHLTTAYVDISCRWRQKLQSVFGVGIDVKLDLFHAVKRIVGTVLKR